MEQAKQLLTQLKEALVNDANAHEWNKMVIELLVIAPNEPRVSTPPAPAPAPIRKEVPLSNDRKTAYRRSYTLWELQDWNEIEINGTTYGINKRGDLINDEGEFIGWCARATKKVMWDAPEPDDWRSVMA